ncbi:Asp-tRNA(Asn) amidotransferase subunit GatC [Methanocaldococcus infernus]|uniref:Asp/Glu amidotransferase, subunit C n=1 Tax=Methanocaldococcus infernus (strain DSM 11812 / JCM 15783 / ME) TaxID=573063 RepID=D5VSK7_METIM|nr:Asp-tRNA(Asn) amidotransferase subunit GatC [Methanocaldococcus infernus]ADG13560.1 Asp/Glu amidotransferase, subunit C [Methanocaldococcus infernus ME]
MEEKIKKEAMEIIEKFSSILEKYNLDEEESLYIIDKRNVLREDEAKNPEFREKFLKLAPKTKDGYVVVEKGSWVK